MAINTNIQTAPWQNAGNEFAPALIAGVQLARSVVSEKRLREQADREYNLNRMQVESMMSMREAQAAAARAKLETAAAYSADRKQGWDRYSMRMAELRSANASNPDFDFSKASADLMFELAPQLFAGEPDAVQRFQSSKLMGDVRLEAGREATRRAQQNIQAKKDAEEEKRSNLPWQPGTRFRVPNAEGTGGTDFLVDEKGHPMAVNNPGRAGGSGMPAAETHLETADRLQLLIDSATTQEEKTKAESRLKGFKRMVHMETDAKSDMDKLKAYRARKKIDELSVLHKEDEIDALINSFDPSATPRAPAVVPDFRMQGGKLRPVKP